jgi:sugar lactone lactonase YvrE
MKIENATLQAAGVIAALALALLAPGAQAHPPDAPVLETVADFDPSLLETPEGIVLDHAGNIYVSLALTGEIRKITPDGAQSTLALLPIGPPLSPCGSFFGIMGALAIDPHDTIYVTVASCDPADRGIWKVSPDGGTQLVANLPLDALPNGIALRHGRLYVADSALPRIWTAPAGGGLAEVWIEDPVLATPPGSPFPGANGIQIYQQELYVSVSGAGTIVAIPFESQDSPGSPRIHATLPAPLGCDDFAFDHRGALYCTTDPFNRLLRIAPDGTFEVLLTAADGLDGPTSAIFGRLGQDRFNLYITNAAFPFFSTTHQPRLMRLHLGIPGAPRGH